MAPRTLASLAHALGAAADLDAALVALTEALSEFDRSAHLALLRYDARREMLRDALSTSGGRATAAVRVETTFDHIPGPLRVQIAAGGQFIDFGEQSAQFARLLSLPAVGDGGALSLRGIRFDGTLAAVLALYEPRRIFGTRVSERFAPSAALFDLAYTRFGEQDARAEAVQTLESVTQRVHGDYLRRLSELEGQLATTRASAGGGDPARELALERKASEATEQARRATRRATAMDQQVSAAVGQLEQAHIELHRRSEALRQKTRTLYLIDRVLTLDAEAIEPRQLVDGLLALVGDDMQAQRCSLMLRSRDQDWLFVAAMRGHSPEGLGGARIRLGEGVAGRVALSREPLLVQDVREANSHPLLHDQHFTTGSFISFPLVYHGDLVGVLNLSDRARGGSYGEEDVERVRLLALLVSLVTCHANLAERLREGDRPAASRPAGAA